MLINYLYAKPSFIGGMARTLDLAATLQVYNNSETENEADSIALFSDWVNTGDDIESSILEYGETQKEKSKAKLSPTTSSANSK